MHTRNRSLLQMLTVLGLAVVYCATARASVIPVDFESFAAEPQTADFLAADGIASITLFRGAVPESPTVWPEFGPPHPLNPGGGNFLAGEGNTTSGTRVMTFDFSTPLESFSFRRIDADGLGSTPPAWTAVAYDSGGGVLDSVGESFGGGYLLPPSDASFSLEAAPGTIASVVFTTFANLSTFGTVPLDDVAFVVPEPSSVLLTGMGLVWLGLLRRRGPAST